MKAKLTINGKEFEVEISEEQVQDLTKTKKKTGYERVKKGEYIYVELPDGKSNSFRESYEEYDNKHYNGANYYSDETVAANNARADKLYRQLRRFAVEHRINTIDWNDENAKKHCIYYSHDTNDLLIDYHRYHQYYGVIFFDTYATARLAIDTFKDELLWYFTEYKDSL